jgi:hypothetical protein
MEKELARAAAINSSGLVTDCPSKLGLTEYGVSLRTPLSVEISPVPSFNPVCHMTKANQWLVVDSCRVGNDKKPAPLAYLEKLGVKPAEAVRLVVATHWHNDHIKGLREIAELCEQAKFVCPQVLLGPQFATFLELQNKDASFTSDTSEFDGIIRDFTRSGRMTNRDDHPLLYAVANKRVFARHATDKTCACEIFALSPSDPAITSWLQMLSEMMAPKKSLRKRTIPPQPNQISSILWLTVGSTKILLSADMEEDGNKTGGWKIIVESNERPQGNASVNKVAHHGSENGHCDEVWSQMLEADPIAIITPYNCGRKKLPAETDIKRITQLTKRAFITSPLKDRTFRGKTGSVNRTIHEVTRKIRTLDAENGYIRLRKGADDPSDSWQIELFGKACHLSEAIYAEDVIEN